MPRDRLPRGRIPYNGYTATPIVSSTTTYRNHGAYVAAMGGGSVAAHSCLGMPVQAHP